jgi:hypothetical protein
MVALTSQEIAVGAATELGRTQNKHPNAVIASLRSELNLQGEDVQISDPSSAAEVAAKYAGDPEMQAARDAAVREIVAHLGDAAFALRDAAQLDGVSDDCRDSLEAVALVVATAATLSAGVWQLCDRSNMYSASALLRQLVEAEFVLWKFSNDIRQARVWLHSTPEQRRNEWKPSNIYRDNNNEYRQKDYSRHCELGGHPTPLGARLATGINHPSIKAATFSDTINHCNDAWTYVVEAVAEIDQAWNLTLTSALAELDATFRATVERWAEIDSYRFAVATFSDPIP